MGAYRIYDIFSCNRCKHFKYKKTQDPFDEIMGECSKDGLEIKQGEVDPLMSSYNCPDFIPKARR